MADFAAKLEQLKLAPATIVPAHVSVGTLEYLQKALAERRKATENPR